MTENEIDFFQFVDNKYRMDHETEQLIGSNKIEEGMVLLIAGNNRRVDLGELMKSRHSDWLMEKALKHNRRFTVSNVHYHDGQVTFLATYSDGTILERSEPVYTNWYVKVESLQETPAQKKLRVIQAIHDALLQQDSATYHGKAMDGPKASDIADHIYTILGL